MLALVIPVSLSLISVTATLIPSNSSDPINKTIGFYTDPVLQAVAADSPSNTTYASVNFTNGLRSLPGAYFNFTELAGTVSNLTTTVITFAFPANLSTTNNIFSYHVHEKPVSPDDEACTSTGGHYDPFFANGTEGLVNVTSGEPSPLYNPSPLNFSTYQIGDLAGKWGALSSTNGSIEPRVIFEHYIRLSGNFSVLGRSVVIHDAPTNTRIACGNITQASAFSGSSSAASASASGNPSKGGSNPSNGAISLNTAELNALLAYVAIMIGTVVSVL